MRMDNNRIPEEHSYGDLKRQDFTKDGVLDEETIIKNLSNLGRTADGAKLAYLSLSLPGFSLKDIKSLAKFKELQSLELSYNQLKDLSVLSELPYLLSLSVSHNHIEKLFDFLPPYNLKEASFSFNQINEIGNLSNFHYLQTLELNNNGIRKIEGLEYCQRLKNLDLSHNFIKKIEGLDNLPLVNLDLRSNEIKKIEGLNTLRFLRNLNLSGNQIRSFEGIPDKHEFLEKIDLENNKISNLVEIQHLVDLNLLRDLNLHNNPVREVEDYRLAVIFKIPKLTMLDRRKIDPTDKVNAKNLFHPSPEYIASRDHMTNFIFNIIQDHKVKESTLPSVDSPYPILILCGPEGSGCSDIARKLSEEYSGYFDYVVAHTTRKAKPTEKDKINYNFIKMEEFEQDVTLGKFICCNEYFGDWYGVQWDSIEAVARQGLACVTQMELESLLSFKQTYFEPRCVLILTLDRMMQIQRLINQGCNETECEIAVSRTEWYADYNREHPGFFDAVIVTDDINDGYENLKNLVLNYLGVANQEQESSAKQNQIQQNLQMQRQLSTLQSSRPKTNDDQKNLDEAFSKEFKEYELPRSDSFLPSNTATGNRSQMSHMSIESLSQIYNQNLRLKFGSAPAQLLTKGEHAEKSLEKRVSAIKKQFEQNGLVTTKSQMSNQISKQAMQGTVSSNSWTKWEAKSKSREANEQEAKQKGYEKKKSDSKAKYSTNNKYEDESDSSEDDDIKHIKKLNNVSRYMSQESSRRSSNMSTPNSIE